MDGLLTVSLSDRPNRLVVSVLNHRRIDLEDNYRKTDLTDVI